MFSNQKTREKICRCQKRVVTLHRKTAEKPLIAKIAQLVEHDLAKVGVAGSSPVFRSSFSSFPQCLKGTHTVRVVELVDTLL